MPIWWAFWGLQYWQLVISVKLMKPIWRRSAIRIHHNDGRPVDMTVSLNTLSLVTHICIIELDYHWYRSWIFAYTVQGHYRNHFPYELPFGLSGNKCKQILNQNCIWAIDDYFRKIYSRNISSVYWLLIFACGVLTLPTCANKYI